VDGTVSAPGLSFSSEVNSGLFRAAANDVRLSVNSAAAQVWVGTRSLIGRIVDSTNAKFQVESSADSYLLELANTTAAQFGGVYLKSNDRTFTLQMRSSTNASGEGLIFDVSATTVPYSFRVNTVEAIGLTSGATPNVRVANTLLLSSAGTATNLSIIGTANRLDMYGGSSGWRVMSTGGTNTNLSLTDGGTLTVRTQVDCPIFNSTSARKYKTDIKSVDVLELLKDVKLRSYVLKGHGRRVGLVADEAPRAVRSGQEHIDLYGLAAVGAAGAAALLSRLERLETHVGL
jgi:hypothetical protein